MRSRKILILAFAVALVGAVIMSCTESRDPVSPSDGSGTYRSLQNPAVIGLPELAGECTDANCNGIEDSTEGTAHPEPCVNCQTCPNHPDCPPPPPKCVDANCNGLDDATEGTAHPEPCVDCTQCPNLPECPPPPGCVDANCNGIDDATEGTVHPEPCVNCERCPNLPECPPPPGCVDANCNGIDDATEGTTHPEPCVNCELCPNLPECEPPCDGCHNGHTPGYWHNKNGNPRIDEGDLAALRDLCLRNADGSNFDPTTRQQVAAWINGQNATNMAAKLSSHLAAMVLNVRNGDVPGCAHVVFDGGEISIEDLIADANASLCADGYTPDGDEPNRGDQETMKNALDQANNNNGYTDTERCD